MKKINIYLQTSMKGFKKQDGAIGYVIEYMTSKGPATRSKVSKIQNMTPNAAELNVLSDALEHLTQPVELTIYTDSKYLQNGLEKWMESWERNGWVNKKGEEVANRKDWELVMELIEPHIYSVEMGTDHSYKEWLHKEVEREAGRKDGIREMQVLWG